MTKYTVELQMDYRSFDLILPFPDEVLQEMGWGLGDIIEWIDNKDGTFTLRKIDNA